jgi:hypothetical protein
MKTAILLVALMVGVAEAGEGPTVCDTLGNCYKSYHVVTTECTPTKCPDYTGNLYLDNTTKNYHRWNGKEWEKLGPVQELIAAAEGVLPYLDDPNYRPDSYSVIHPIARLMPTELELAEQEVERLKKKAEAIRRFRDALKKAGGR